ncbi:MAG: twin-arginine translocation signal domain-containing protein [Chloroflexi bacterium]|nr:twin-arginine translocation signal domain-containing protein [Chloroflexota bacterium]
MANPGAQRLSRIFAPQTACASRRRFLRRHAAAVVSLSLHPPARDLRRLAVLRLLR